MRALESGGRDAKAGRLYERGRTWRRGFLRGQGGQGRPPRSSLRCGHGVGPGSVRPTRLPARRTLGRLPPSVADTGREGGAAYHLPRRRGGAHDTLVPPRMDRSTLQRLLETWSEVAEVGLTGYGHWTLLDPRFARGLDPDACYWVGDAV